MLAAILLFTSGRSGWGGAPGPGKAAEDHDVLDDLLPRPAGIGWPSDLAVTQARVDREILVLQAESPRQTIEYLGIRHGIADSRSTTFASTGMGLGVPLPRERGKKPCAP